MKATTALFAAAAAVGVAFLLRHPPALLSAGQSGDQVRIGVRCVVDRAALRRLGGARFRS